MSRTDWFHQARYGLFIHWGPYAAAGRGEWVLNRECIPFDEYEERYVNAFTADAYDPAEWAQLAVDAGMKYAILTTRHHDGFALWPTDTNDWHAGRLGPQRDLVGPYVEACRTAGLRVGLYYSVADWHHPDYPGAYYRDWPGRDDWADEAARKRYIAYYRAQIEELLTRYGTIDILWYDGAIPEPLDGRATNERVYQLQPDILLNERLGEPFDYRCSEQSLKVKEGPWEACMTLNGNWGYHAGDRDYKTPRDVIRMLLTTAGSAGNLLLNVGPRADGTIPEESQQILRTAGAWLKRNDGWLAGSERSPFSWNNCSQLTVKGNTVYVHLLHSPGSEYCLAEIAGSVRSARYLASGEPVAFEQRGPRLWLKDLPDPLPDPLATTIALELDGPPRPITEQTTFWIPE